MEKAIKKDPYFSGWINEYDYSILGTFELSDFDINKIIKQTVSTFEGRCREKKIAVQLTLTNEKMIINADKTRIQQVIYNLLDNAIKFSHSSSIIKIETTEKNSKLFVNGEEKQFTKNITLIYKLKRRLLSKCLKGNT